MSSKSFLNLVLGNSQQKFILIALDQERITGQKQIMAQEHPLSFNFKGFNFKDRISGKGFLAIATIIFGASNSVSRRLQELGDRHLVDGRNPISFCNSLFVGNLSALIILTALYHQDWNLHTLKQIKLRSWILLRDSQRNNSPSF